MKTDLLVIDARHLLWRMSDTHQLLHVVLPDGTEVGTGGIYGFLSGLLRIHQRWGGLCAVAWEGITVNFRKTIFPEYKANHDEPPTPEKVKFLADMRNQEKLLRGLLSKLGVRQWDGIDCEGDDVIGTLANRANAMGARVAILSGDGDIRQLVTATGSTVVVSPSKAGDITYDWDKVVERYGVTPPQIPDIKALGGDSGDNIPGLDGIGEKTAAKLVNNLGDIEGVISAAGGTGEWPVAPRFKEEVLCNVENLRLYKRLATIQRNVKVRPVKIELDRSGAVTLLKRYQMRSLLEAAKMTALFDLGRGASSEMDGGT